MTIPEELRSPTVTPHAAGQWMRRPFHAPRGAAWVPASFAALTGLPALPALRGLRMEADGSWSAEEYDTPAQVPLGEFLTKSAAPVWVFVSIVQQCLSGLVALHRQGLRHAAISPATLLVNAAGHVVLSGCGGGADWLDTGEAGPADGTAPAPPHAFVVDDLRDLGRTFRAVLGGDAGAPLTVSRTDIAPLVSEWIDWLADPEPGHEAAGAQQAETIFNEIRTGRPGYRPWKYQSELPPAVAGATSSAPAETPEERRQRLRKSRLAHGTDFDWRTMTVAGLIIFAVLAGGSWALLHFVKDRQIAVAPVPETGPAAGSKPVAVVPLQLPDEIAGAYDRSSGDTEPQPDTEAIIANLNAAVRQTPPEPSAEWERELQQREADAKLLASGAKLPPREGLLFLYEPDIFPPLGQPTNGRTPGDYYLVWRTDGLVLTADETRAVQSALLRTARYCGVRVMAWVVLPNHAGVVLRVPPPRVVPDENLARRIAILRGEKTAASVTAQLNAKLKAGDNEGADQVRRTWMLSMGSAAGFFSTVRTVPVVGPTVLAGRTLWAARPLHLSILDPAAPDLLRAAATLDTAAVTARLATSAHNWPFSSLSAALLNYGPALRAISVLMQKNPETDFPVPPKENLLHDLRNYRRHLGDLPAESALPNAGAPLQPAQAPVVLTPGPQASNQ